jgi:hypothetical protein
MLGKIDPLTGAVLLLKSAPYEKKRKREKKSVGRYS